MELQINGTKVQAQADPAMPLLWVLRDVLNLTGTKFGCGVAACGACTVHLDGQPVRSCVLPVAAAQGKSVRTIESLGTADKPHALQLAWIAEQQHYNRWAYFEPYPKQQAFFDLGATARERPMVASDPLSR